MTDETSQLLSDTAEKLFSDHVTKNCIIDAEKVHGLTNYGLK